MSFSVFSEPAEEKKVFDQFFSTAFGIKSRTIDIKDAEKVIKAIKEFQLKEPKIKISKIHILTCASSLPLPKSTTTPNPETEHIKLANQRHEMVISELQKNFQVSISGESRQCGVDFQKIDLNDRFVVPESGALFEERFKSLSENAEFMKKLKEETNQELSEVREKFNSPFLAKYRSFQGIRLEVYSLVEKTEITPVKEEPKKSSSRSQ